MLTCLVLLDSDVSGPACRRGNVFVRACVPCIQEWSFVVGGTEFVFDMCGIVFAICNVYIVVFAAREMCNR